MKEFLWRVRQKIQIFMQGRYGNDELNRFLCIAALVCFILSGFGGILSFLYFIGLGMLIWSLIRSLSRNIYKRQEERSRYIELSTKVKQKYRLLINRWKNRKTHLYCKCPQCKVTVRVRRPENHGMLSIPCPMCKNSFNQKA